MCEVMEGFTNCVKGMSVEDLEEGSIAEVMEDVKAVFDHSAVKKYSLPGSPQSYAALITL